MSKSGQINPNDTPLTDALLPEDAPLAAPPPDAALVDTALADNDINDEDYDTWSPPLWLIGAALAALVLAIFVGVQVFRAVSGLVFPESPPRPDDAVVVNQQNISYGVDEWTYTTELNPCEAVLFYESEGSICTLPDARRCDAEANYNDPGYAVSEIAHCVGTGSFSVFGLRWEATIYNQYLPAKLAPTTHIDLERNVLWSGPAPLATSTPAALQNED